MKFQVETLLLLKNALMPPLARKRARGGGVDPKKTLQLPTNFLN